ncbi:MAG: nucleotidyltransferase family protein [Ignavibacteriaceae bacterium]
MMSNKNLFEGIVLAAGLSSRMNSWKPGKEINGSALIVYTIRPMLVNCSKIIVVGGYNFEKLNKIINDEKSFSYSQREKIILIKNNDYQSGMFSSVKFGLTYAKNADGVFILPGDIPFVKSSTYLALINNFDISDEYDLFLPAIKAKTNTSAGAGIIQKGHPVLLRKKIIKRIISHSGDTTLRMVLKEFTTKICIVNDEGIIFDIDNEDDFKKIKSTII